MSGLLDTPSFRKGLLANALTRVAIPSGRGGLLQQERPPLPQKYKAETWNDTRRPLNFPLLIKRGAVRITETDPRDKGHAPNNPESFAIQTLINDRYGPTLPALPDKPQSYAAAARIMNAPDRTGHPWLSDGKYRQIIDSAKLLRMSEEEVFLR